MRSRALEERVDGRKLQHVIAQPPPASHSLRSQVNIVAPQLAERLQVRLHVSAEAAPRAACLRDKSTRPS